MTEARFSTRGVPRMRPALGHTPSGRTRFFRAPRRDVCMLRTAVLRIPVRRMCGEESIGSNHEKKQIIWSAFTTRFVSPRWRQAVGTSSNPSNRIGRTKTKVYILQTLARLVIISCYKAAMSQLSLATIYDSQPHSITS